MCAAMYRKRSSSFFDDPSQAEAAASPPPPSKRARFRGDGSPRPRGAAVNPDLVAALRARFPSVRLEFIEKALEECENNLDSAIKCLLPLRLEHTEFNVDPAYQSPNEMSTEVQVPNEDITECNEVPAPIENVPGADNLASGITEWVEILMNEMMASASNPDEAKARLGFKNLLKYPHITECNEVPAPIENVPGADNLASGITEWVEILMNEMMASASNPDEAKARLGFKKLLKYITECNEVPAPIENVPGADNLASGITEWVEILMNEMMASSSNPDEAKARVSRVLEAFHKSSISGIHTEAMQRFQKEFLSYKEQFEAVIKENTILKKAVAIQHVRQKEHDERNQELQQLKQLALQYREQIRGLEINNYALSMHLRQAQQGSSIPGHFHRDIL